MLRVHDFLLLILALPLPFLAVALRVGCSRQFVISLLLTLLFFLPGVVYAWWVILTTTDGPGNGNHVDLESGVSRRSGSQKSKRLGARAAKTPRRKESLEWKETPGSLMVVGSGGAGVDRIRKESMEVVSLASPTMIIPPWHSASEAAVLDSVDRVPGKGTAKSAAVMGRRLTYAQAALSSDDKKANAASQSAMVADGDAQRPRERLATEEEAEGAEGGTVVVIHEVGDEQYAFPGVEKGDKEEGDKEEGKEGFAIPPPPKKPPPMSHHLKAR